MYKPKFIKRLEKKVDYFTGKYPGPILSVLGATGVLCMAIVVRDVTASQRALEKAKSAFSTVYVSNGLENTLVDVNFDGSPDYKIVASAKKCFQPQKTFHIYIKESYKGMIYKMPEIWRDSTTVVPDTTELE